jgi:hypothetical protein
MPKFRKAVALSMGVVSSGTHRAGHRATEELELEHEGMLIELLTTLSELQQAAAASGRTPARGK